MNSSKGTELLTSIRAGDYHIYPEHIRNIPIPNATSDEKEKISSKVKEIIKIKNSDCSLDVSKIENEINYYVNTLYDKSLASL